MLRRIFTALVMLGSLLTVTAGHAEEIKNTIASEATTGNTDLNGSRKSKTSDWSVYKAPENYVLNQNKTAVNVVSARGSEHTYKIEYDDYVEVIPGTDLKQPTSVRVQTHSRSNRGAGAAGGNMKITVDVYAVKYK